MHSAFMSTGVDSTAPLAQENMPYDNGWVSMNPYPQSTMAGFASSEFGYMPPITTHDLPPHDLSQDGFHRMPPLLKHASDLPLKQQQQQQQQQQSMPPQSMAHQTSPHHQQLPQLPMLTVPSHPTWPSMLTNPPSTFAAQTQSIHTVPRSGPLPPQPPPLRTRLNERDGKPNPRKMLTDDDRRRMCEYAEMNPGIKQSEIGAHFGVERSTVSKVLRNKDKYTSKNDRSKSPGGKKSKGAKFPDIERALVNWVRNAQKTGIPVTDTEIKEKLRFFATNTGNVDTILKSSTASWLEKFKQKNGIGSGRLVRRASETNIPKRKSSMHSMNQVLQSPMLGAMDTDSPLSPVTRHLSGSPTSPSRSDEERDINSAGPSAVGGHQFIGFGPDGNGTNGGSSSSHNHNHNHGGHINPSSLSNNNMTMGIGISGMGGGYKPSNNQSTTSLTSVFTETPVSSFSGSALSPTAPFTFSPDANVGSFLTVDAMAPPGSSNFQRPRSQTLPALNLDYDSQQQQQQQQQQHQHQQHQQHDHQDHHSHHGHHTHLGHLGHTDATGEAVTPKYLHHHHHMSSTAPSSAVDSPMTDVSGPSYGLDSAVVSPQLRRSGSNGSLFQNPRSAGGLGGSTILGSPLAGSNSINGNINGNINGSINGSINNNGNNNVNNVNANTNGSTNGNGNTCGSAPNSPTQDDARRAADTLLTFIRTGQSGFDQTDFKAVARMIEKLRLQQSATTTTKSHGGMGGLSQIPEGEGEMGSETATHLNMETSLTA